MNKRTIAGALAAALAASTLLTGCATGAAAGSDAKATDKGIVAMSFAGMDIQIWVDELKYMKADLAKQGYELLSDDPQWNVQNQVNSWESWIQRGDVKAIMGYPVQSDSMDAVTAEANTAGIPVVAYATTWKGVKATMLIDNYSDGFTLGLAAGEWIVKKYGSATVPVGLFSYYDNDLGRERSNGIKDGLAKAGAKVKISDMPALTVQNGSDLATTQLAADPNTKVWLSVSSDQMIGAYRSLIQHGVKADDPDVLLGALDATNEALDVIKKKDSIWRLAYILPAEELAANNVKLIVAAAEHKKLADITMKSTPITADNVDSFYTK